MNFENSSSESSKSPLENNEQLRLAGDNFSEYFSNRDNISFFIDCVENQRNLSSRIRDFNEQILTITDFNMNITLLTFLSHSPELGEKYNAFQDKVINAGFKGKILPPNPRRIELIRPKRGRRFVKFLAEDKEHKRNIKENIKIAGIRKFCLPIEKLDMDEEFMELVDQMYIAKPLGEIEYQSLRDIQAQIRGDE